MKHRVIVSKFYLYPLGRVLYLCFIAMSMCATLFCTTQLSFASETVDEKGSLAEQRFVLPMSVISRNISAYNNFLAEKNSSVFAIDNLESKYSNRNVACMVIIMQALALGGFAADLQMIEAPNYARELKLVAEGQVAIMHQDAWQISIPEQAFQSSEIIAKGHLFKGIYVAEKHQKRFNIDTVDDLKPYTAVSNPEWIVGWNTLDKIGLKALYKAAKKEHMFNLVLFRGVDFTIQEFANTDDLSYKFKQGRLIPIPGVKLALSGSRHFVISKKHPQGPAIYKALETGLSQLRARGTIERFLTESGFYRKEVLNWKTISVGE